MGRLGKGKFRGGKLGKGESCVKTSKRTTSKEKPSTLLASQFVSGSAIASKCCGLCRIQANRRVKWKSHDECQPLPAGWLPCRRLCRSMPLKAQTPLVNASFGSHLFFINFSLDHNSISSFQTASKQTEKLSSSRGTRLELLEWSSWKFSRIRNSGEWMKSISLILFV